MTTRPLFRSPAFLVLTLVLASHTAFNSALGETPPEAPRREFLLDPNILQQHADGTVSIGSTAPIWSTDGIADFQFTDQLGRTVTKETFKGKPFAICFVFTKCLGPCPAVTYQMRQLQDRLKNRDVNLVTLTVDPERDTVEVLKAYADKNGADHERWRFLTGDRNAIYELIQGSFRMPVEKAKGPDLTEGFEVIHTSNVMLVDAKGVVQGKFNAVIDAEMASLRRQLIKMSPRLDNSVPESPEDVADLATEKSIELERAAPPWVKRLPATNAMLNGLATILLIAGYAFIKAGQKDMHRRMMLTAFMTSVLFLASYLTYHYSLHYYTGESGKKFLGTGLIRPIYFTILITHVVLAAVVPIGALRTIWLALNSRWEAHKAWARVTFPIWLYVSITGVIIYFMLYHWPTGIS